VLRWRRASAPRRSDKIRGSCPVARARFRQVGQAAIERREQQRTARGRGDVRPSSKSSSLSGIPVNHSSAAPVALGDSAAFDGAPRFSTRVRGDQLEEIGGSILSRGARGVCAEISRRRFHPSGGPRGALVWVAGGGYIAVAQQISRRDSWQDRPGFAPATAVATGIRKDCAALSKALPGFIGIHQRDSQCLEVAVGLAEHLLQLRHQWLWGSSARSDARIWWR